MQGKQGLLATILALIIVVGLGIIGYKTLGSQLGSATGQPSQSSTDASTEGTSTNGLQTSAKAAPMLVDHDATLTTPEGEQLSLTQIADGKPLVINFWATWCPYCIQELPDFAKLLEEYGDRVNFAFVDVVDGQREKEGDAAAWLAERNLSQLPLYLDLGLEASSTFAARALPTTVIVAADGEIVQNSAGVINASQMRVTLSSLVAS